MIVLGYIWLFFSILWTIGYCTVMYQYWKYWKLLPVFKPPNSVSNNTTVSVLIPARNEAHNIKKCLSSLLNQTYPKTLYEVLIIDDFSEDTTADIVKEHTIQYPNIRLVQLQDYPIAPQRQSFKKQAIEIGIEQSSGQLIVTTDADCIMSPEWLNLLVSYFETFSPKFIAAPVSFHKEKSLFERFQSLDFIGMMGVTGAGIFGHFQQMCNGANMAYPRSVFKEVQGYQGVDEFASGDDMFLLHKIAHQYPMQIAFLKHPEAMVYTTAKTSLSGFFKQRIRWATKNNAYDDWKIQFRLGIVFIFLCSLFINIILSPFLGVVFFIFFLIQLLAKGVIDYIFLNRICAFFKRKDLMKEFIPSLFLHIGYIIGIGFASLFVKKYTWKGRSVR